jgi:hypothetical protein
MSYLGAEILQSRPIWIPLPGIGISMCWNITGAAGIAILKPCASDIVILLVDHKFHIFQLLHVFIGRCNSRNSRANADQSHLLPFVDRFWVNSVPIAMCAGTSLISVCLMHAGLCLCALVSNPRQVKSPDIEVNAVNGL